VADIDVFEVNEAFAAQALAVCRDLEPAGRQGQPERQRHFARPPDRRHRLHHHRQGAARAERVGGRYALVTMCIGGGQGIAAIFERLG
jgi:acetyl-CoA C-acetyltransferase